MPLFFFQTEIPALWSLNLDLIYLTVSLGDWLEKKKSSSYNHKTTIWVSHEYYLNPEFHKIPARAFWVIVILRFFPYVARVDFKGLISK